MLLPLKFLFLFLASVSAQGGPPPAGEPQFTVMMLSPPMICTDDTSPELFQYLFLEADIHNETTSWINGNITFTQPITADHTAELKLIKEENGQAKMMMTECIIPCKEWYQEDSKYLFIIKYIEPAGGGCPMEAGVQKVNFMIVEVPQDMLKQSNEGCYMASISVYKGDCDDKDRLFLGCVYVRFCIEPV